MACSVDSAQVHQAWQNTSASEEADGLGRKCPFPLIGDKNKRFCRAFGILDEEKGVAQHAMLVIDGNGDLIYRELIDSTIKVFRIVYFSPQIWRQQNESENG